MMKRTIAGILLLAVGACLLMIAVSFAGSAELDPYHINFKSGDALLAETDSDLNAAGNSLHVEAQYDPPLFPGGSRSNKDWVEVNNWSSEDRAFNFSLGGSVTFNIWYSIRDEGYDAEPEFRFKLYRDDEELVYLTGPVGQDDGSNLTEYSATGNFDTLDLGPEQKLLVEVQYRGWEDCDVHFDNASCDSGFVVDSDFVRMPVARARDGNVTVEIYDAFDTDWEEAASFFEFLVDDEDLRVVDVEFSTGEKYQYNGSSVTAAVITWSFNESLDEGDTVELWSKFTLAEEDEEKGFQQYLLVTKEKPDDPEDNEDDDEESFLPGFETVLVLVAFGLCGVKRRRR